MKRDLNCDLGEGEPSRRTAALMRYITSANIACGGHAGDAGSMRQAVRQALKQNVYIGAHPGLNDGARFGREPAAISSTEFETLLIQQVSALETIARAEKGELHHIKLHGALYHITEINTDLRRTYIRVLSKYWPRLIVFAGVGGKVLSAARDAGLRVWPEGFLDRGYSPDGNLVPRGKANALLNRSEFRGRLRSLRAGKMPNLLAARTWCIHSDTPHAVEFARLARAELSGKT
jgi:UPF0271 protein